MASLYRWFCTQNVEFCAFYEPGRAFYEPDLTFYELDRDFYEPDLTFYELDRDFQESDIKRNKKNGWTNKFYSSQDS